MPRERYLLAFIMAENQRTTETLHCTNFNSTSILKTTRKILLNLHYRIRGGRGTENLRSGCGGGVGVGWGELVGGRDGPKR